MKELVFLGNHTTFWHLPKSHTTKTKPPLFYRLSAPWRFSLLNSKNRHTPTLAEKFPATLLPAQRPASRKSLHDRNWPIENQKRMQAGIQLQSLEQQALKTTEALIVMLYCNATLLLLVYSIFFIPPANRDTYFAPMSLQMCYYYVRPVWIMKNT